MVTQPAVSFRNLGQDMSPGLTIGDLSGRGIAGAPAIEGHPEYVKADNEVVMRDRNGSYIVLGRDRPGSRMSGYGGRGEHQCSRIDMVVGRVSAAGWDAPPGAPGYPIGAVNENKEKIYVDPHFGKDAARIYISAKANIDEYFGLRDGSVGESITRSAIGIKADAVRIIGREGIKLVTRPEPFNSQAGEVTYVRGIDLIAGNDDTDLQPMVKGRNLVEALEAISNWIGKMNGVITTINVNQQAMATALMAHTHWLPGFPPAIGPPGPPINPLNPISPEATFAQIMGFAQQKLTIEGTLSLMAHRCNGEFMKMNFLKPWGRKYILSRHNNVN